MDFEESIKQNCPELAATGLDLKMIAEMMEERFLGELEIFFAAVGLFMEGHDTYISDIQKAITQMDRRNIASTAHRFKGAASNFHSTRVTEIARDIEINAEVWEKEKFATELARLQDEMAIFLAELNQLVKSFGKLNTEAA